MIRLQLSGRLNWQATIAATDLPELAKQKITDVVESDSIVAAGEIADRQRADLAFSRWSATRARHVEELVSEFGGTQTVARLMRSAKKRNRPLLWKTFVVGCYSFLAFFAFYAGLAVWFFSGKPNPTVDYLYALNATARAVPVEERAWPIYRNAWIEHDFYDLSTHQSMEPLLKVFKDGRQQTFVGPLDKEWQQVIRFLEEHKTLVDAFRVGGQRAGFGLELAYKCDYSEEDFKALYGLRSWQARDEWHRKSNNSATNFDKSLINIQPPRLQMMQGIAAVLRADTLRAAEEGQAEVVVEDITAMLGLGTQVAEYPFLLFALLGFCS